MQDAQGLRRHAVGQAGDPPAAGDARGQGRGRRASSCYHAAWLDAQGVDCVQGSVDGEGATAASCVNEVVYDCQQFHGGFGYMRESTIERMLRDARVLAIGGGATEVMLEEVAKRM